MIATSELALMLEHQPKIFYQVEDLMICPVSMSFSPSFFMDMLTYSKSAMLFPRRKPKYAAW